MHALLVLGQLGGCRLGASWRGWRDFRVPSRWPVGDSRGGSVRGARGVTIGTRVGVPRVARCGTAAAGLDNYRGGGRVARCSSCLPDPRASRLGAERGNYPVVTPLLMMDHRIVAWAPGGDGLVANGRAPASGTAARATPGSVVPPSRPRRHARGRRERGELTSGPAGRDRSPARVGDGAPSRRFPGQIDATGLGDRTPEAST
jgi:hypothetical protein